MKMYKYPRTRHLEGSRYQIGDDLEDVPFKEVAGKYMVVEEKVDGSNSAVSFSDGRVLLQSRGHYLSGGPREKQFDLFKNWANTYYSELRKLLSERYVMYGEWLYAKHTIYYNRLPDYFIEFDIFDKEREVFLSTDERKKHLRDFPFIHSARVLYQGIITDYDYLVGFVERSGFIEGDHINEMCSENSFDKEQLIKETDSTDLMEGLYIKVEEDGIVKERFKYVRSGFLTTVNDSESHWQDRPIVKNKLGSRD